MIYILQLVLYLISIFSILYSGFVFVNMIILIYTLPSEELLPKAIKNTNLQIQHLLKLFIDSQEEQNYYSDFHAELIHQASKLSIYLNTIHFPNGIQREGQDFYLWLSKMPVQQDFDDWKIQLRQTVRSYNDNLDVIFNMVEEEPYLKLKNNLITKEDLNRLKHSQAKPLYSDEGEI